jgi:hypothetical protein
MSLQCDCELYFVVGTQSQRCTRAIEHEFLGLKWRSNFTPLLAVICSTSRLIVWKCICLSATMVL